MTGHLRHALVDTDFFQIVNIPLRSGKRVVSEREGSLQSEKIINDEMAHIRP